MELSGNREVYPLIYRCIDIEQWRLLAQSLDLPVTGTSPDLQVMVEGKLKELEQDPANVELVMKKVSDRLQRRPTLAPVSSCPSLASSRESVLDELTDTGLREALENANAEVCSLRQLSEKQRLALMECKCLLSDAEEKATELALKNQQLTKLLAETETRETELALENQQLTESLAGTEEKLTKLVFEREQLGKHSSDSKVECLKHELLQAKVRVKELWKHMCDQIREFDYAFRRRTMN
ncbi:uncharacterized protein [Dysidea avara]|uniref:uncharacterized protein isoform X3 n=1 Tax=Dysidea avara TaxID=196820 RepID=UPI00331B7CA8